jgi:regulator of nucleoside diphosphate kinase
MGWTNAGQERQLTEFENGPATVEPEHELERAIVFPPQHVAEDVVTMNSRIVLHMDEE